MIKYPENFHKLLIKNKNKNKNKKNKTKKNHKKTVTSKTCKRFCKKVFLPARESVEMEFAKRNKIKYFNPSKLVKKMYLQACDNIYCQKKCQGNKLWLKSFTKKRKDKLIQQGAMSGCRDVQKEFPDYYKAVSL